MESTDVIVAFQISETELRTDFSDFIDGHLDEDINNVYSGKLEEEDLKAVKEKASAIEYDSEDPRDKIVIYTHETLEIEQTSY